MHRWAAGAFRLTTFWAAACARGATPESGASAETRAGPTVPTITLQQSGTTQRLQAVSAVDDRTVWASGLGGTFTVTSDGGATWRAGVVPGAERLEFRDVEGQSDRVAYLLSAGTGTDSRIYYTEDGGGHWTLQFQNEDAQRFYDCFAFFDNERALVMADAVNGRFPVLRTRDGRHWEEIADRLPAAQAGEGAFAASGTCVATAGRKHAWIATGGGAQARILATTDGGDSWVAYRTPVVQGAQGAGLFSVAFRDVQHGIVGAGNLEAQDARSSNIARSSDGGASWQLATGTPFPGAAYGVSYIAGLEPAVVATGPAGAAWSSDEGQTWQLLPGVTGYWAVASSGSRAGWLVGTEGRILKFEF